MSNAHANAHALLMHNSKQNGAKCSCIAHAFLMVSCIEFYMF